MTDNLRDTNDDQDEARRDSRQKVIWSGVLTKENDQAFPCSILDVSYAGTLVESAAPLAESEEVLLTIDGLGDFAGRVKWQKEDSTGLLLMAGPNLLLKKFAEASGADISKVPVEPDPS